MKVLSVVGARPQFVKLGPIARAMEQRNREGEADMDHIVVHTGQHFDTNMSQTFFDCMELPEPDVNLRVGGGSHGSQTGRMLQRLDPVMMELKPDLVLVYGDTNSTLAAALAAVKLHISVGHVEAGLRSYRKAMPEEVNRVFADHSSSLLFCPTATAVENLRKEGLESEGYGTELIPFRCEAPPPLATVDAPWVLNVGDVMCDATRQHAKRAIELSDIHLSLGLVDEDYVLMTVHRAENTDDEDRLEAIVSAAEALALETLPVVLPLHPRTRAALERLGRTAPVDRLLLIDAVSYLDMLALETRAKVVLTDSGGVQKEAFFLGVPCVTLRDETEWTELVECGWNRLAGADTEAILEAARVSLASPPVLDSEGPFGDEHAAERIVGACLRWWDRVHS